MRGQLKSATDHDEPQVLIKDRYGHRKTYVQCGHDIEDEMEGGSPGQWDCHPSSSRGRVCFEILKRNGTFLNSCCRSWKDENMRRYKDIASKSRTKP